MLSAFAFWLIFYNPSQGAAPEPEMYVLLLAIFGAFVAVLSTLRIAGVANQAVSYPLIARLPSRIELLISTFLSALLFTLLIQLILALIILVQPNGVEIGLRQLADIPPIWLSVNIFVITLALHATDLVMKGWSRVWVFGVLTILLFSQSYDVRAASFLSRRLSQFSIRASQSGQAQISQNLRNYSTWVSQNSVDFAHDTLGFVFWPIRAVINAVQAQSFDNIQSLAPALLILYAVILFLIAADLFSSKDLYLTE